MRLDLNLSDVFTSGQTCLTTPKLFGNTLYLAYTLPNGIESKMSIDLANVCPKEVAESFSICDNNQVWHGQIFTYQNAIVFLGHPEDNLHPCDQNQIAAIRFI